MSGFACLSSSALHSLQDIVDEGSIFTSDDCDCWNGSHILQFVVGDVIPGSNGEFQCWLLDHHLPCNLIAASNIVGQSPSKICQFNLQVLVSPSWKLRPGMELSCRAVLFMIGSTRKAMVRTSLNLWINATRTPVMSYGLVHLCAGAFQGWSQAARKFNQSGLHPKCAWEVSVEKDEHVCVHAARASGSPVILPPFLGITKPFDDHLFVRMDVADFRWLACIHSDVNTGWTASCPCQPFSKGNRDRTGINDEMGRVFFHICKWARIARPLFVALENVSEVANEDNMATLKCFAAWAGFVIQWSITHDMCDIAPCHRKRWLAVLVRADIAKEKMLILPEPFKLESREPWTHDLLSFAVPQSLKDQLVIPEELFHAYGARDFLPCAKKGACPLDASFQQVLQMRITPESENLPTLVANYSAQHLLPINYVKKTGLYADLTWSKDDGFMFQPPTLWAVLMGNLFPMRWPQSVREIFHFLGNAISVPHAALALLVALDAIDIHDKFFSIVEEALHVWKCRLTSDVAVCIETNEGYAVINIQEFFNRIVFKTGLKCADIKHEVLISWDNGVVRLFSFRLGLRC